MPTKPKTRGRPVKKDETRVFDVAKPARPTSTEPMITTRKILASQPRDAATPADSSARPGLSVHSKTIQPPADPKDDIIDQKPTLESTEPTSAAPSASAASPATTKSSTMPEPNPTPPPEQPTAPAEELTETTEAVPAKPAKKSPQPPTHEVEQLIASKTYMVPLGTSKHRSPWLSVILLVLVIGLGILIALYLSQTLSI